MNTAATPPAAPVDTPAKAAEGAVESSKPQSIEPFSFPFSPEVFAPAKRDDKPWHQKGNKSNHDQRPGAAPKGSRRSMGKR
ncbi:hypothetical protein [Pseudomonas sp. N040]|uniref:hypothetical protein n=1 Tax=Pseudomonas sp. N040 TaxID=2785325 RepID=UPI0018A33983|nr:hypothetical protein [Pseudomonas sp. N040]MBF7731230.1 hypothetical protein [Pseudomonas sp. N040]MBW7014873.1 hypothetical protein [Pseudomonas sp. N040]